MTEDFIQSTGQPRLSMLVDDINSLKADLSSVLKDVSTGAGLIELFGLLKSGKVPEAQPFKHSLELFDASPSGRHVIAALCDGLRAAGTPIDIQLLQSADKDYHFGKRQVAADNNSPARSEFFVSVPDGGWCPKAAG